MKSPEIVQRHCLKVQVFHRSSIKVPIRFKQKYHIGILISSIELSQPNSYSQVLGGRAGRLASEAGHVLGSLFQNWMVVTFAPTLVATIINIGERQ
jgi:hypothetical protein